MYVIHYSFTALYSWLKHTMLRGKSLSGQRKMVQRLMRVAVISRAALRRWCQADVSPLQTLTCCLCTQAGAALWAVPALWILNNPKMCPSAPHAGMSGDVGHCDGLDLTLGG